jgi:hypothetical protein
MKRRSFVVLISDLFSDVDDIIAGLEHLKFAGHNVVVVQTLDAYELEFPFQGTWRFDGLEGEEPLTTQTDRMRESYLANLNQYLANISARCVGSQIDYTMANTKLPLHAVLSEIVLKRQNLSAPSAQARS